MRQIGLGAITLAAVAGVVTASILGVNLVAGSAVDVPSALIVAAVTVVAVGQVWVIVALRTVLGTELLRRWNPRLVANAVLARINPVVRGVLGTVAFGGWLIASSSAPAHVQGSPNNAESTCAHTLNNHGTHTA
jgi:hypothetical protein